MNLIWVEEVAIGEAGEICVREQQVTRGYWNNAESDACAFDINGYFKTGDIGIFDEQGKLRSELQTLEENVEAVTLDIVSGLGHGAALHFPDMPWAEWKYTNAHKETIERKNLPDFINAADMACKVVQAFCAGVLDFEGQPGLPAQAKADLEKLLKSNQDHDEKKRLEVVCNSVAAGAISGLHEPIPPYIPKGEGSWKALGTGITSEDDGDDRPAWTPAFEESDYRKFHDAVKEHRFVVIQEILPANGVRLA